MEICFDEIKRELDTVWILLIDGRSIMLGKSICHVDELSKTVTMPRWLVEQEGLEGYVL